MSILNFLDYEKRGELKLVKIKSGFIDIESLKPFKNA